MCEGDGWRGVLLLAIYATVIAGFSVGVMLGALWLLSMMFGWLAR